MNSLASLRTERMLLTRMQQDDLDDLIRMYSDQEVMATLGGVRSPAWTGQYLERQMAHWKQHGFGFWTVHDPQTGQFAGRGGLRHATIEGQVGMEVGYGLAREFWGKGWATELARESGRGGFAEWDPPDLTSFALPANAPRLGARLR